MNIASAKSLAMASFYFALVRFFAGYYFHAAIGQS